MRVPEEAAPEKRIRVDDGAPGSGNSRGACEGGEGEKGEDMGDEFWGKKGEEIAGKGGCEDGVEGAEDGERGVAEEGEKEMGLELGGKT